MASDSNPMPEHPSWRQYQQGKLESSGRAILAEVVRDLSAAEATLWILSDDGQYLKGTLNHGPARDEIERITVPVARSIIGMVASTGVGACCGPDAPYNRAVDQATHVTTTSMVATPVLVRGRLCGVVSAINAGGGGMFTGNDLKNLQWKAHLLGLMIADECQE